MIELGKYHELKVIRKVDFGVYLQAGDDSILLPIKYVPKNTKLGDSIRVFVYKDSEDRIIATTLEPYATVGDFALLKVTDVNATGAFLDWGIAKDLFVPFREQNKKMETGKKYMVYIYIDEETERITASARINRFIEKEEIDLKEDDIVELLIAQKTDMGFNAIINNKYWGLLFKNEIFTEIAIGHKVRGYIKQIREDKKIDLTLQKRGAELIDHSKWQILKALEQNEGFLALGDQSSPDEIYRTLNMSKKTYKKSIGNLYKEKLIQITENGIKLLKKKSN